MLCMFLAFAYGCRADVATKQASEHLTPLQELNEKIDWVRVNPTAETWLFY